uniref:Hydroperoxide isomerase ALOXE3-like n=1 Tax=Kryptolebias marmoratus TaxID=37003 RepID=A0A3Q2ZE72_KRYMA
MVNYELKIFTSTSAWSSTLNYVYIKLVGTNGESERTLVSGSTCFITNVVSLESPSVSCVTLTCHASLGELVLIEVDKQPFLMQYDNWFPAKVEVKSPEGKTYSFPIYRWIIDSKEHRFRDPTDHRSVGSSLNVPMEQVAHLQGCKLVLFWDEFASGIPHCMKTDDIHDLPCEVRFSFTKEIEFDFTAGENKFCSFVLFVEYIREHWMDDELFGYQFLNGVNPMMIRRCSALPSNFPVTDNMVFLHGQESLADEMSNGNIFLCDYKILDGVKTNTINGKKQYLMAPLVLLQKTPDGKLMPIAIQLKQDPAEDNPIFCPTDSEYDWLLAKIFVRSADSNVHQLNFHLLRTHLLAEVFAVSLLRNLPMVHPLYKLLIPHTRYTLQINFLARKKLISADGVFTQFTASGGEGMITILRSSLSSLTYSSLCMPEDIAERGLEDVPNFYYRDDGLKLWDIIHRFVKGVLSHYYKKDDEVQKDTELQKWIGDIFEHGFLSHEDTVPQRFTTVDELIKFVTMVIFTGSVQHAAVNSGQYDFGGWMPNAPLTLQRPPPTKKGEATEATMLATLPDVNVTVQIMDTLWLLSQQSSDFVPLGQYPEDHFTEETPRKVISDFQGDLEVLSTTIRVKNRKLELPYPYLDPAEVENSVAI